MHRPLNHEEIDALNKAAPCIVPMTRDERLEQWANVIEKCSHVIMAHRLEFLRSSARNASKWEHSPMQLAAQDTILKEAGLRGETVQDAKNFFEITDADIHAFSCDCGGLMSGQNMAYVIRRMKGPAPNKPQGFVARIAIKALGVFGS